MGEADSRSTDVGGTPPTEDSGGEVSSSRSSSSHPQKRKPGFEATKLSSFYSKSGIVRSIPLPKSEQRIKDPLFPDLSIRRERGHGPTLWIPSLTSQHRKGRPGTCNKEQDLKVQFIDVSYHWQIQEPTHPSFNNLNIWISPN